MKHMINDHFEKLKFMMNIEKAYPDRYLNILSGISNAAEELRKSQVMYKFACEQEELLRSTKTAVELFMENENRIKDMVSSYMTTSEIMEEQFKKVCLSLTNSQLIEKIGTSIFDVHGASLMWEAGISKTITILDNANLFSKSEPVALRLLEPSRAYAEFFESTAQKLSVVDNLNHEKALKASLYLTESQFIKCSDILSSVITPEFKIVKPAPIRPIRLPIIQQNELLSIPDISDEEDEESLTMMSPSAGTALTARDILELIIKCNENATSLGNEEIFKPTQRMLEVYVDMPWLIPEDKRTFADFVDCLYFLLYEGCGKDNLRFLKENGGVADKSECEIIWNIKSLRNKWLRHDPEHGSKTEIKKNQETLRRTLKYYGLKRIPYLPEHFRELHRRMLDEASNFLKMILERL